MPRRSDAALRGAAWLAVAAALGALAACRVPFAERAFFEPPPPNPAALDCRRCHMEVYDEWAESPHAHAWRSEAFQAATHAGGASECNGCHAPAPLLADRPPVLRPERHEEGVTCISCHLSAEPGAAPLTMRGPAARSLPVEVHPVVAEDPSYRRSEMCGGCHASALAEWREAPSPKAGEKETCQGCHMPEVHRTVESANPDVPYSGPLVALEKEQPLRRHRFAVPDEVDEDVGLRVERKGPGLALHIENRIPHALPTGSFGRREVRAVATWSGGRVEARVGAQPKDPLAPGEVREITLALPEAARREPVHVALERWESRERRWLALLQEDVAPR